MSRQFFGAILFGIVASPSVAETTFYPMDQFMIRPLEFDTLFAPYAHALASLGGWAILMFVLLILSAVGTPRRKTESGLPVRDYSDPAYRRHRAFQNAIEITGPFLAATLAAMLVGVSPFWVNVFASVFLVSRVAMAAVHIGTEIQPLRSAFWFIGVICILALAVMAVLGAFAL